ncbi:MAG TPA: hypothetical protein VFP98_07510 [Candidatus Polarisedimenticolia bacterium]|nr:hypothetical protein [Candidatus Polarisedimenticolia bacterium]
MRRLPTWAAAALAASLALAAAPFEVRVTGRDFRWHILYPGPDGRLDTPDDLRALQHLHLPARTKIELDLRSDDYVYGLNLPDLDAADLAVPGRPFVMEFRTEGPGTYRLLGNQMCGGRHPELIGDLVVLTPEAFGEWSADSAGPGRARP